MEISESTLAHLEDFGSWARTGPALARISLLDFVGFVGTPDLLLGYAELFFPMLVEHRGASFLSARFDADVYDQWAAKGLSNSEIQRVMNHVHISTLVQNSELTDELVVTLANAICTIWRATLSQYGLRAEAVGRTVDDAGVTFYAQKIYASQQPVDSNDVYDEDGLLIGECDGTGALIQETVWLGDIPVATL